MIAKFLSPSFLHAKDIFNEVSHPLLRDRCHGDCFTFEFNCIRTAFQSLFAAISKIHSPSTKVLGALITVFSCSLQQHPPQQLVFGPQLFQWRCPIYANQLSRAAAEQLRSILFAIQPLQSRQRRAYLSPDASRFVATRVFTELCGPASNVFGASQIVRRLKPMPRVGITTFRKEATTMLWLLFS